jgi:chromosome segregation ATPase
MTSLMRSIAEEARDRSREIQRLEAELEQLLSGPGEPTHEIRRVEDELFGHRREIEQVQKELSRLGRSLDAEHPERIVCSIDDKEVSFEPRLDETEFRQEC